MKKNDKRDSKENSSRTVSRVCLVYILGTGFLARSFMLISDHRLWNLPLMICVSQIRELVELAGILSMVME